MGTSHQRGEALESALKARFGAVPIQTVLLREAPGPW
jgi:hypothetical protein